jgi:3-phenylpropionate/cinnamic acid dioxygenase small subunit
MTSPKIETKTLQSVPVGLELQLQLQYEIEQFLYTEARLLDERRFEQWFALLADDLHYYMPTRYNRLRREAAHELSSPHELAHFDDDKPSLEVRLRRLQSGAAWSEEPPSRTRHLISNVQVRSISGGNFDEYEVDSCFLVYRSRVESDQEIFAGSRRDRLRRVRIGSASGETETGWQIARRTIVLDQTVITAANLGIFF